MITRLKSSPRAYSFFQALRLLDKAAQSQSSTGRQRLGKASGIGSFTPPRQEFVRLKATHSLRFPEAELDSIHVDTSSLGGPAWILAANIMGLTGAMGVLPFHYTELLLQRVKAKDQALAHFLDLFNHRTLSLFYRAGTKYRLPLAYERAHLSGSHGRQRDPQTRALLALIGLGTGGLEERMQIRDESLIYYGGLLVQQIRTASGLKQMLQDYFAVPVTIDEFLGRWEEIMPDARSRLVSREQPRGQNAQLGRSLILGQKGWFAQSKVRIRIGPLKQQQFFSFAPGTRTLDTLNQILRLYMGPEIGYDIVIEVARREFSEQVSLGKKTPVIVGWNTWLGSSATKKVMGIDTLTIRVPARNW